MYLLLVYQLKCGYTFLFVNEADKCKGNLLLKLDRHIKINNTI